MQKRVLGLGFAAVMLSTGLTDYSAASSVPPTMELSAVKKVVVKKTVVVKRPVVVKRVGPIRRGPVVIVRRPYRVWGARPYYGVIFAGVALGTIIAVSAAHAAPPPPDPNACWFWSDPTEMHGYWDYCTPP